LRERKRYHNIEYCTRIGFAVESIADDERRVGW